MESSLERLLQADGEFKDILWGVPALLLLQIILCK